MLELKIRLKTSEQCDVAAALVEYLSASAMTNAGAHFAGADADALAAQAPPEEEEIGQALDDLNSMRQTIVLFFPAATSHDDALNALDDSYNYSSGLKELSDRRVVVEPHAVQLPVRWTSTIASAGSMSSEEEAQEDGPLAAHRPSNLLLERASVLFNIGALEVHRANLRFRSAGVRADRTESAYTYQFAFRLFAYLRTSVADEALAAAASAPESNKDGYTPAPDLSPVFLRLSETASLAQGQICLYEAECMRKVPVQIALSKIAAKAATLFREASMLCAADEEAHQQQNSDSDPPNLVPPPVGPVWHAALLTLSELCAARAEQHEAQHMHITGRYGYEIARLEQAVLRCESALHCLPAASEKGQRANFLRLFSPVSLPDLRNAIIELRDELTRRKQEAEEENNNSRQPLLVPPSYWLRSIRGRLVILSPSEEYLWHSTKVLGSKALFPLPTPRLAERRLFRSGLTAAENARVEQFQADMLDMIHGTRERSSETTEASRRNIDDATRILSAHRHKMRGDGSDQGAGSDYRGMGVPPHLWKTVERIRADGTDMKESIVMVQNEMQLTSEVLAEVKDGLKEDGSGAASLSLPQEVLTVMKDRLELLEENVTTFQAKAEDAAVFVELLDSAPQLMTWDRELIDMTVDRRFETKLADRVDELEKHIKTREELLEDLENATDIRGRLVKVKRRGEQVIKEFEQTAKAEIQSIADGVDRSIAEEAEKVRSLKEARSYFLERCFLRKLCLLDDVIIHGDWMKEHAEDWRITRDELFRMKRQLHRAKAASSKSIGHSSRHNHGASFRTSEAAAKAPGASSRSFRDDGGGLGGPTVPPTAPQTQIMPPRDSNLATFGEEPPNERDRESGEEAARARQYEKTRRDSHHQSTGGGCCPCLGGSRNTHYAMAEAAEDEREF